MEHPSLLSLPSAHLGPEGPPFFITYSLTRQKNITQLYVTDKCYNRTWFRGLLEHTRKVSASILGLE